MSHGTWGGGDTPSDSNAATPVPTYWLDNLRREATSLNLDATVTSQGAASALEHCGASFVSNVTAVRVADGGELVRAGTTLTADMTSDSSSAVAVRAAALEGGGGSFGMLGRPAVRPLSLSPTPGQAQSSAASSSGSDKPRPPCGAAAAAPPSSASSSWTERSQKRAHNPDMLQSPTLGVPPAWSIVTEPALMSTVPIGDIDVPWPSAAGIPRGEKGLETSPPAAAFHAPAFIGSPPEHQPLQKQGFGQRSRRGTLTAGPAAAAQAVDRLVDTSSSSSLQDALGPKATDDEAGFVLSPLSEACASPRQRGIYGTRGQLQPAVSPPRSDLSTRGGMPAAALDPGSVWATDFDLSEDDTPKMRPMPLDTTPTQVHGGASPLVIPVGAVPRRHGAMSAFAFDGAPSAASGGRPGMTFEPCAAPALQMLEGSALPSAAPPMFAPERPAARASGSSDSWTESQATQGPSRVPTPAEACFAKAGISSSAATTEKDDGAPVPSSRRASSRPRSSVLDVEESATWDETALSGLEPQDTADAEFQEQLKALGLMSTASESALDIPPPPRKARHRSLQISIQSAKSFPDFPDTPGPRPPLPKHTATATPLHAATPLSALRYESSARGVTNTYLSSRRSSRRSVAFDFDEVETVGSDHESDRRPPSTSPRRDSRQALLRTLSHLGASFGSAADTTARDPWGETDEGGDDERGAAHPRFAPTPGGSVRSSRASVAPVTEAASSTPPDAVEVHVLTHFAALLQKAGYTGHLPTLLSCGAYPEPKRPGATTRAGPAAPPSPTHDDVDGLFGQSVPEPTPAQTSPAAPVEPAAGPEHPAPAVPVPDWWPELSAEEEAEEAAVLREAAAAAAKREEDQGRAAAAAAAPPATTWYDVVHAALEARARKEADAATPAAVRAAFVKYGDTLATPESASSVAASSDRPTPFRKAVAAMCAAHAASPSPQRQFVDAHGGVYREVAATPPPAPATPERSPVPIPSVDLSMAAASAAADEQAAAVLQKFKAEQAAKAEAKAAARAAPPRSYTKVVRLYAGEDAESEGAAAPADPPPPPLDLPMSWVATLASEHHGPDVREALATEEWYAEAAGRLRQRLQRKEDAQFAASAAAAKQRADAFRAAVPRELADAARRTVADDGATRRLRETASECLHRSAMVHAQHQAAPSPLHFVTNYVREDTAAGAERKAASEGAPKSPTSPKRRRPADTTALCDAAASAAYFDGTSSSESVPQDAGRRLEAQALARRRASAASAAPPQKRLRKRPLAARSGNLEFPLPENAAFPFAAASPHAALLKRHFRHGGVRAAAPPRCAPHPATLARAAAAPGAYVAAAAALTGPGIGAGDLAEGVAASRQLLAAAEAALLA